MLTSMILAAALYPQTDLAPRVLKATCVWNRTSSTVNFTLGRGERLPPLQRRIRPGSFYSYAWTQGTTHPPLTFRSGQGEVFTLAVDRASNQACRSLEGLLHHRVTREDGELVVTGPFGEP